MRRFRRLRIFTIGWVRLAVLVAAITFLLIRLADLILLGPLGAAAETEARLRGVDAINRIVLGSLGTSISQEDLVTYTKDQQGRIAAFHVNTHLVNKAASEAASAVHNEFRKLSAGTFGIPAGALSGSQLLGSVGPIIPVRMIPIGTVIIDVKQEFQSEGINQTRHRIWLHAIAKVRVVLPMVTREVEVTGDMPVTETVVIGPVPTTLYNGNLGGVTIPVSP